VDEELAMSSRHMFVPIFDDSPYEPPKDPRDSDKLFRALAWFVFALVALMVVACLGGRS
jgi:hypothetical protein